MTEKCAVCNEIMSVERTVERAASGRWVAWPPVIDDRGRSGHLECFIRDGTASLGGRTGPGFMDELEARQFETLDVPGSRLVPGLGSRAAPGSPSGSVMSTGVKRVTLAICTCDAPGDGPCPVHGVEMAAQDERIAEENRRKLRASIGKEFLTAGPPIVHEGLKAVLDEIEAERDWTPGDPNTPGIYAIVVCWDLCEGMFPNVGTWDGARWIRPAGPISFYRGPFATEAEARAWAEAHDPEEGKPKPADTKIEEHLDRRPLGGNSEIFDGVLGTRWELAPDCQCFKCKGPLERTRGLMLMSPWAGAVRCTQCNYRDSVAGYLGKLMIEVQPMVEPKPTDHEVTVTIPRGASADITIVHQPDGSVKADVQLDEPLSFGPMLVIYEGPWLPDPSPCPPARHDVGRVPDATGTAEVVSSVGRVTDLDIDLAVERELTDLATEGVMKDLAEAEPEVMEAIHQGSAGTILEEEDARILAAVHQAVDQETIALLKTEPAPDYGKLIDSDAFDLAFEKIVRDLGLPTEYLAAPGQEVFFVEYKVPALTGDKVHAQGPYLTKHIARGHYEDIFNFEGVEQVEIVGRPNTHEKPHPGQEMLDGAARGKIQDALRTIDRTARAIQKKQEGKTYGYVLPENLSAYRRLCDNLGIPWEEVTEEPKEP